jgi:hypothetical protein
VLTTRGTGEHHRTIPLRFFPENEPKLQIGQLEVSLTPHAELGSVELRVEHLWERLWLFR